MSEYLYKNESALIPEGDYEAKIDTIGVKIIPSGKEKLSIMFRIRDDIEGQGYGNKCVFEDIWKERESPEHFNRKRINQLLGTQKIKDGTVFNSISDVIESLKGANLVIHIGIVFDEYRGEDVNKVSYYKSSKQQPKTLGNLTKEEVISQISDDDIPF